MIMGNKNLNSTTGNNKESYNCDLELIEHSILDLLQNLQATTQRTMDCNIYVAYSGGVDSSVLLHACAKLRDNKLLQAPLHAWHINHQLQANAAEWEKHCEVEARKYAVDLHVSKITEQVVGNESTEMFARRCRYDVWQQSLKSGDILLQAHHQKDQAETLLLRLVRASPNIKGIPQLRYLDAKEELQLGEYQQTKSASSCLIVRPLLNLDKSEIIEYAKKYRVQYIQDESNFDTGYERNYIRHEILPLLEKKWPGAQKSIATSAQRLSSYQQIIARENSQLLDKFSTSPGNISQGNASIYDNNLVLQIKDLVQSPPQEFELVIRAWLEELALPPPAVAAIHELHRQLIDGASKNTLDSGKGIAWQGGCIRSYKKHLYAMLPLDTESTNQSSMIDITGLVESQLLEKTTSSAASTAISQGSTESQSEITLAITMPLGQLRLHKSNNIQEYKQHLDSTSLTKRSLIYSIHLDWDKFLEGYTASGLAVKFRSGGESTVVHDKGPTRQLKNLFQESDIPPWLRNNFPLIYYGEQLIAVPGIGCNPIYATKYKPNIPYLSISWIAFK